MPSFEFLPLAVLSALQAAITLLLLLPLPVARPVLRLVKASKTPVGWTIVSTLALVLLAIFTAATLQIVDSRKGGSDFLQSLDAVHRRHAETSALLSAVLTSANILLMFVNMKLGTVLGEREQLRVSQGALLKQVKGLHIEYDRLRSEAGDGSGGSKATVQELASLKAQMSSLQSALQEKEAIAERAEKAKRTAESNMAALKSQAKGLEHEYDRLLAEKDALNWRLKTMSPSGDAEPGWGGKKDA